MLTKKQMSGHCKKVGFAKRTQRRSRVLQGLYSHTKPRKRTLVETFYRENSMQDPIRPEKRQLLKSMKELFVELKKQHPSVKISLRSFFCYRPKSVKNVKFAHFRQCLCDIYLNPKLKTLNSCLAEKFECVRDLLEQTVCEFEGDCPKIK